MELCTVKMEKQTGKDLVKWIRKKDKVQNDAYLKKSIQNTTVPWSRIELPDVRKEEN